MFNVLNFEECRKIDDSLISNENDVFSSVIYEMINIAIHRAFSAELGAGV